MPQDLGTGAVRPTRHRLFVAIAIASVLLAAALQSPVRFGILASGSPDGSGFQLRVRIQQQAAEPPSEESIEPVETEQFVAVPNPVRKTVAVDDPGDRAASAAHTGSVRDWDAMIERQTVETLDRKERRGAVRRSMWRQSASVMFRPVEDPVVAEDEPLMAALEFKQPAGVLGLGFSVGSCFIGIPLAGIPVEERRANMTLVYCRG